MKLIFIILSLIMSLFVQAQTGSIEVTLSGVREAKGKIQLCLYNSEDTFLEEDEVFRSGTLNATIQKSTFMFTDVPVGTYALLVYWDENENSVMEKNFIGIPKEELGFSHNIFGKFGPPGFEDVSFEVTSGETTELVVIIKKPSHF